MAVPQSQQSVNRLVIAAVTLAFLIVAGLGLAGAYILSQNLAFTGLVTHTYQVQDALARFGILNERVETARRGYLLSQKPDFLVVYQETQGSIPEAVEDIARLTSDNPAQRANVAKLRELTARQLAGENASIAVARGSHEAAIAAFSLDAGVTSTRQIRALTAQMEKIEAEKLSERSGALASTTRSLVIVMSLGGVLLLFTGIGSVMVILAFTRDLTASRNELARLNAGLEDEVRARTADLQRANDEIQRFAYIVSHDLRSPLVNVMGFTSELQAAVKPLTALLTKAEEVAPAVVTADARAAVQTDLPEAITFIRTSTQKMDRLINAILQLSRQGRRVLAPERLNVQAIAEGIVGSLKHRSDELGATIVVQPGLPSIVSDRLALEQILSNLTENALKYLKPGRPGEIVIRGQKLPGERVVFEVQDNGRGVDAKDHERIFELFRRSGVQDQPGEGIGLAHVRALGYRLGGTVTVDSTLDQGSTFRVSLPATLSLQGAAE